MGILDHVESFDPQKGSFLKSVGCWDLYERIQQLKDLKLHTFGHLHFSHGQTKIKDTYFVNASICTEDYKPINPPIIVEL
jgi:Icc-related predicted phosphoesterase